jgi:hypothetical protein
VFPSVTERGVHFLAAEYEKSARISCCPTGNKETHYANCLRKFYNFHSDFLEVQQIHMILLIKKLTSPGKYMSNVIEKLCMNHIELRNEARLPAKDSHNIRGGWTR